LRSTWEVFRIYN